MEYASGQVGRIFAARFHDGEAVYAGIEEIARREGIGSALVVVLGGVRRGKVVVGPKKTTGPLEVLTSQFDDAREVAGVGTIHSADGRPALHLHAAIGRGEQTIAGCPRLGLEVFLLLEVVIIEITGLGAGRRLDPATGLKILAFASPTQAAIPKP
jgi:predicted DNA-binding protein with PD1-like motif